MLPVSEFEGKTVDHAVEQACTALRVPKEHLKYSVISHGSSGIFGLVGVKKAKIRVTLPEPEPEEIEDDIEEAEIEPADELADADDGYETFAEPEDDDDEAPADVKVTQEAIDAGKDILQRIVDFITEGSSVSVRRENGYLLYRIDGGNSAVLIGKRGQNLEATQYIVEKIVNKRCEHRVRVRVDIEGYLEKRKEQLESLAQRVAEKVRRSGKPITINRQMNAHDRRIVHIALKDDTSVRTQSMGEGFYRKLVIFPKKKNKKKKEKANS